ncbi:MAG: HEAT repeat domain-containing protein [Chitinophagaceae bacterium]|nr:HEAT repeat domain-containing protein [Chitinophagaceae bacterium]
MKKCLFLLVLVSQLAFSGISQHAPASDTSWKTVYRETAPRINNLVHTKLDVRPDFSKQWLHGKAWLTLRPHFYPTDSLTLDAKGMEIKKIALVKGTTQTPLQYKYDDWQIRIQLGKTYKANESYTIYIEYISRPDEFEKKYEIDQMLGMKGLYFINPTGEDKEKPTQIWTQGETESASVWFPTIDKTAQKTTQELTVTVDDKYVTLSNGKLVSQKKNTDGTRSDTWKMDLPHSPYLFFLGVGDYAVIKDTWKGKEVNYYVEKEYASVARRIFGNTPEMMTYFSKITGVEFPWVKYSQITGRDYMAGAMENTTATIHQESAQQDARELVDGNSWEGTIAHELFHQWFGDYVTAESWSNLTLNESFADYSQTLWEEYKYGQDAGDAENYSGLQNYLQSGSEEKHLVRFFYGDKEEMFDQVSYQKGGRILHMLRNFVGDSAFFKAINLYLTTYKFKSAEAHQWRLALEEVTGRDLNWFFNQWYFNSGHPTVDISYVYDDAYGKATIIVKQLQKSGKYFRLPIAVDIYNGNQKTRHTVWATNAVDSFHFSYTKRPDLINVDGDKVMLWNKKDNKTLENFIHQYNYAGKYLDRREAIEFAARNQTNANARALLVKALNDPSDILRRVAINSLDLSNSNTKQAVETVLANLAKNDKKSLVRADAILKLGEFEKADYADLFKKATADSSYTIAGAALISLSAIDPEAALAIAKELVKQPSKGLLTSAIMGEIVKSGDESYAEKIISDFAKLPVSQAKFESVATVSAYLAAVSDLKTFKWGIDEIVKFRNAIPAAYREQTDPYINGQLLTPLLQNKTKETFCRC